MQNQKCMATQLE